jgi:hypothetical protein
VNLPSLDSVNYTLAILGIVGLFVGWWRGWWESPRRREARARDKAVAEAILGEPAVHDLAGKIIAPAQPGLVARTSTLEQAVSTLVDQDARIKYLETNHGARIKALEDARVERLVSQAESAHMWRAVADNAADLGDEPSGEL